MKVAVISDLHIGHSFETHQLGHSDHDFAHFLFKLEKLYDIIVLLGDIFEIEMEPILNDKTTFELSNFEHNTITKRFKKSKYVYVFGNHDLIGSEYGGLERYEIEYNNKKYLFLHGHQFDHICQLASPQIAAIGGICLKFRQKRLYQWASERFSLGNFSVKNENEKIKKKAVTFAIKNGYDYIITGHTHEPKINYGEACFMNSGTCTHGRLCYLHMDLENEMFEVRNAI